MVAINSQPMLWMKKVSIAVFKSGPSKVWRATSCSFFFSDSWNIKNSRNTKKSHKNYCDNFETTYVTK